MAVLSLPTADGREATTGNASAVRRLGGALQHGFTGSGLLLLFAFFSFFNDKSVLPQKCGKNQESDEPKQPDGDSSDNVIKLK